MTQALLYSIAILAGGGGLLLLLGRWLKGRWSAWAALGLFLAALSSLRWLQSGPFEVVLGQWVPLDGWFTAISYRFDTLSQSFALLAALFALLLLIWLAFFAPSEEGYFSPWILFLLALFLHLLSSTDLLLAYAGWELLILATYFLLVYRRAALPTAGISEWFLGTQHLAGYPLVIVLLWLGRSMGTLQYSQMGPGAIGPVMLLLLLGTAWVRMAQVPFQVWAFASAETAGPVSTLLLAGGHLLAGPYLWLRFLSRMTEFPPREVAMIAGSVSLLVGAALALRQESGRQVLAGDTVSRLGLFWMALGMRTPQGVAAGLFLLTDFVLSKVAFHVAFSAGGRLGHPVRQTVYVLGMWGAAGLPLSAGFVGRWLLLLELFRMGLPSYLLAVYLVVIVLSLPLTLGYLWRAWTLLPRGDVTSFSWGKGVQQSLAVVGFVILLPLGGLAASWLWRASFEKSVVAIFGELARDVHPFLEALQPWMLAWAAIFLLIVGGGAIWSGLLPRRRPRQPEATPGAVLGLLQEPMAVLLQETAWMTWIGRPRSIYRFFGRFIGWVADRTQRLVVFLERHTTYFLLVTLILLGVILVLFTR